MPPRQGGGEGEDEGEVEEEEEEEEGILLLRTISLALVTTPFLSPPRLKDDRFFIG